MNKIALVATWFGISPPWLDFWLLAASRQSFVDFLLFSDCIEDRGLPNVRVIPMTFAEFVAQAGERIGVNVPALHYSKVYDLRPTFGESLEPWLREYELWGYCDMDCIFGDLNMLAPSDGYIYDAYLVSTRHPMGFLSVFRNSDQINSAWRLVTNALRCLRRDHGTPLDESWFGNVLDIGKFHQHRRDIYAWPRDGAHMIDPGKYIDGKVFWRDQEFVCFHFGHPAGWRDRMSRFEFDSASTSFSIRPDGMVSI